MPFIRTVLGDIEAANLGTCYAHEHIIIDRGYVTERYPEFLLEDVAKIAAELTAFHAAGGRAMVDSMPCDCGRNAQKLAEVSRRSGVHIICPTGLHLAKYYPPRHWSLRATADELTELFVADIQEGIDALDYSSPLIKRTGHRAGVIKVAAGRDRLSDHETRVFTAAARTQVRTGCPILTHTEEGTAGLEQIAVLRDNGADLHHVVLSHTDRQPDPAYHRELLQTGVNLEYDSAFRWKSDDNPTLRLLVELLPEFPDQLMLGMDAARSAYWQSYGGAPGLTFLLTTFRDQMRTAGIDEELLEKVFVSTPARAYAFA